MADNNLSLLVGDSANFLEEVYEQYRKNPGELGQEWGKFFRSLENGQHKSLKELTTSSEGISLLQEMGVQNLLNT
ncbi:MAG: hypothetical protein KDK38_14880, partial [Leptospiraceae bacterium]|nr:hypothetical protein [Leptospiraceae bacterium]